MRIFVTSDSLQGANAVGELLKFDRHHVDTPQTAGAGALLASGNWSADAVIAVMSLKKPPKQRFDAILVEVGIAVGRGIPVLLLTRRDLPLPSLAGVPRIDSDIGTALDAGSLLRTQIRLFLEGIRSDSPRRTSDVGSPPQGPALSMHPPQNAGQAFEQKVGDLLRGTGSEVLSEVRAADSSQRADFAIYLPGQEAELGIVLVEAKAFSPSANTRSLLREAAQRLSIQVINARAGLGLLVYDGERVKLPTTPLVVAMTLTELTNRLTGTSLPDALRQARNEAIHAL